MSAGFGNGLRRQEFTHRSQTFAHDEMPLKLDLAIFQLSAGCGLNPDLVIRKNANSGPVFEYARPNVMYFDVIPRPTWSPLILGLRIIWKIQELPWVTNGRIYVHFRESRQKMQHPLVVHIRVYRLPQAK